MRTKNVLISFLAVLAVTLLVANLSAIGNEDFNHIDVKVDGTYVVQDDVATDETLNVDAGDTINVMVRFTAQDYDKDVTVKVTIEGDDDEFEAETKPFDVENGSVYRKTLSIEVPKDLDDKLSDYLELEVEIDGDDLNHEFTLEDVELKVQRPSYKAEIKSVVVPQTIEAGETFPVEIVLKNIGYNDLDDLYVTARIDSLGVYRTGYFGDIVALECDDNDDDEFPWDDDTLGRSCDEDDEDSVSGTLYLEVPYGVANGVYNLEVEVSNDDTTMVEVGQIAISNDFENTVFKSGNSIWFVNPTDNVVGYTVVAESPATLSQSMVFVAAGSSQSVAVDPNTEGEYTFDVNVFDTKGTIVETLIFSGNMGAVSATDSDTNPIVVLTVILAIIFIVLLIVLIVLIGKKPEKSTEFGESYY